jgi:hypothetical protein
MDYPYTNLEIKVILERYKNQKEYRRVYYKNKYHTDPNYKQYVRDYNKVRYENKRLKELLEKGNLPLEVLEVRRAINIKKYFTKQGREEDFNNKYPAERLLVEDAMKCNNSISPQHYDPLNTNPLLIHP